jgi:hypothetical protein
MIEIRVPRVVADLLVGAVRPDMTPAQRECLQVMVVAGDTEGPTWMRAGCRLNFMRWLVDTGQVNDNRRGDRWTDEDLDGLGY